MCVILCCLYWRRRRFQRQEGPQSALDDSLSIREPRTPWNDLAVVVRRSDQGHEAMDPPLRFQGEVARVQELSIATAQAEYDELWSAIGSSGLAPETLQDLDSEDRRQEEISTGRAVAAPAGESEISEIFEVAKQTGQKDRIAPEATDIERLGIPDVGGSGARCSAQLEGSSQQKKLPQLSALPTPTPAAPLGGRTGRLRSRKKGFKTQEEPQRQERKKSRWQGLKWVKNLF